MVTTNSSLPEGESIDNPAIDRWLEMLPDEFDADDRDYFRGAAEIALQVQSNLQAVGERQLRHSLSVAEILAQLHMDRETVAAAMLLGVLNDPQLSLEKLERKVGISTAKMVDDLGRIGALTDSSREITKEEEQQHAENLRRLLLGIAEDVRVILVVVAEQLQLMRTARNLAPEQRRRVAKETQDIYAPLANRLGIWQVKWELEDLALRFLHPDDYKRIASQLDGRRSDREQFIKEVMELLKEKFLAAGVHAEISGRPKHIFSIWKKMQRKAVDIEQIFDLRAVRVLVDDIAQCYAALGVVHGLWKHIPGEFDDYIATPKANLYRSIHTAVIGPEEKTLEVQIRTRDMHHHAELGVAAHWRYKEDAKQDKDFERRIVWMRQWLEKKDFGEQTDGLQDAFDQEMEATRIYVLTPMGKVVELPKNSTPLDFAYAIHTDIGHTCRGARVDGHIVQLNRALRSGETVEVLTAKNGTPSRDWINPHLGYLHSSKARNRVKQWFKQLDYEHHVELGRSALEREMTRLSISEKPDLEKVAAKYNLQHGEDVYAAIGRGDLSPIQVAGFGGREKPAPRSRAIPDSSKSSGVAKGEVVVAGVDDLMTTIARCCKPVPYDAIIGYVTRGRGVTVHRRDCPNVRAMPEDEQDRLVAVHWSDEQQETQYAVDFMVTASDRKGLLRDISAVLTNENIDVIGVNTNSDRKTDTATMRFTIEVKDMNQLSRVLSKIEQLQDINLVKRLL
ncbi:MAG: bifunctional (p)ppGpp synthetase/guanosine-3',5'-bis(diphosphate) 3'-pyrophosphohydrolase [Candidatus Thiodiazotropha weberae]|uniref:GTP pyrophosphokinase n=1 Tax=Candidatus Thiodiazotropha endoloripes TaxID=1818881 RepID=A0A1E2UJI6_9GAMM|nr:bifunctional (p)ppGpp synthetase/guanosine-3',5'-bis(diphosphate) 3'-pyrophosphohydrolase [Candidatus Thiodiazotropha endoloripes]MCG7897665.1 bifunctional (p)ppGpp synthetase/guanosine-3',5'-bis(diphosphate) 3'-pyrophosphohydrolase [Candidatus Thiodiazotropha weberae]ODB83185.1 GTP diphosphokinase [Candidatus Thiodiazotropha endoloripes]ODB94510.1 GTP diphosphokinase [Candidatus Thiodiazotropha endoloripes]